MKKTVYILGILSLCVLFSCSDWLNVNDNPSKVSNTVPSPDLRLRSIQMQFIDAYESSGTRASWITQNITKIGSTSNSNDGIIRWDVPIASTTWPYQAWFVYCASNLQPLIDKATAEEAWSYVGAAQLIHAWGFMLMLDLYGEMPYTDALGKSITPVYDDGKIIYYGCLDMLEKAIENLSKPQPVTATPLSGGDIWNGGDTQKWIKLAYGLKARWLNNISKKKSLYDPQAILAALEKAPGAVNDNTVMRFINSETANKAGIVAALQFTNVSGTGQRLSKWYTDLLTNDFTGGSHVQDPRATRIIPSGEFNGPNGKEWRLSKGVDLINSDIRLDGGPVAFEIRATKPGTTTHPSGLLYASTEAAKNDPTYANRWYTTSTKTTRQGDSVYITVYSDRLDWIAGNGYLEPEAKDDRYYANRYNGMRWANPAFDPSEDINVNSTGSFYIRADAHAHLVCYHEMCFIKAEVLFRQGKRDEALQAYKAGIRAHMEAMNEKLKEYPQVLGKEVISENEITSFLNSDAVAQSGAELTMAKIMQQKQIAMSMTMQNWTDMRRFNYSVSGEFGVVYPDFGRPSEVNATGKQCYPSEDPNDPRYWPRRFQQCAHEVNYNSTNWLESNPEANKRTIISYPVWWDTEEE
ncbi:MAG: SusD/RagB family nutrient-binding outer membrane lipoprotein [Tannerella sp.]|jgi:hypothetical protein|nr:SusD/RagB family nutrient-binding outer membrane lipoprotein [Tannerella sp.]